MKVEKSFEELRKMFEHPELAEKLLAKKRLFNIVGQKINDIEIEQDRIKCVYRVDSKYKYNLMFTRDSNDFFDFNLKIPSLFFVLVIGALIGLRFVNTIGVFGIVLGVILFYIVGKVYKSYLKNKLVSRIKSRWTVVLDSIN